MQNSEKRDNITKRNPELNEKHARGGTTYIRYHQEAFKGAKF